MLLFLIVFLLAHFDAGAGWWIALTIGFIGEICVKGRNL